MQSRGSDITAATAARDSSAALPCGLQGWLEGAMEGIVVQRGGRKFPAPLAVTIRVERLRLIVPTNTRALRPLRGP